MQCRPEDGLTGPSAIVLRAEGVHDLSDAVATMSGLLDAADPVALVHAAPGPRVGGIGQLMQNTGPHTPGSSALHLLAPCDLQVIKAAGVTVTASLVERVIEEQAMGDPAQAASFADVDFSSDNPVRIDFRGIADGTFKLW